jgi:BatD DUF11 like domain
MRYNVRIFFVYCWFCFVSIHVMAQKFYAQIGNNSVPMGQAVEVAFTLENANLRGFTPPAFKDFQVVGGPNQSSSTSFVNGVRSSSFSISYYITPKHEGTCIVEAASAKTDNSVYNSATLKIIATKGTSSTAQNSQNKNQNENISTEDISNSVFIKLITNKNEAYIGEPVAATFRLYTDRALFNVQFPKAAAFNGFWKNDIVIDQNQPWNYEIVDGKRYAYIDVQKVILFPQKAGKAEITPIEMEAVIQQQSKRQARSLYEELFGMNVSVSEVPIKLKSKPLLIKVNDFPANSPIGFGGVVGSFTIESSIDKEELNVDEPISIKMKMVGKGNFQSIEPPVISLSDDLESYEPEIKENISVTGISVGGTKQFNYMIVPRQPGTFTIPSSEIVCFNPETKKYYTLKTKEYILKVRGKASKPSSAISAGVTREIDLAGISNKSSFNGHPNKTLLDSNLFLMATTFPFLAFIGLVYFKRKKDSLASDVLGNKQRKASKVAMSRLSIAKSTMSKKDTTLFYNEINKSLLDYLSHKLIIPAANLDRETIALKLAERNINDETISCCIKLIDDCEMALFSPESSALDVEKKYREAFDLITSFEEKLK